MKQSRTARPSVVVETPTVRSPPLVELLVDTKAERFELMVRSGLRVVEAVLEEDRTTLCGPRYVHQPARARRGARGAAANLPDAGAGGPVESARRRADARGRGDAPVCPQLGAGARGGREPWHQ